MKDTSSGGQWLGLVPEWTNTETQIEHKRVTPDGGIPSAPELGTDDMWQSYYVGHINSVGLHGPSEGADHCCNLFFRTGLEMFWTGLNLVVCSGHRYKYRYCLIS